jgi:ribosome-associated protein
MQKRIDRIVSIIDEKKGENIEIFNLDNSDYIAKAVVIATTMGTKHGFALLNDLKTKLKPAGEHFLAIEESDDWSVIDLGDILIHLMSPEYRDKYQLEEFLKNLKKGS